MSEVVIRCPNCGTTGGALGECDACHEAERRYFCTNHTPGRWLDEPLCADCGARFGVERIRPRPIPRRAPDPPPRPRAEPPAPLGRPAPPIDEPAWTIEDILGGPARAPHRAEVEGPGARDPRFELPPEAPFPPFGVRVVRVGGCVRRLVMLVIILIILAALAFFGLLGIGSQILFGASGRLESSPSLRVLHGTPGTRNSTMFVSAVTPLPSGSVQSASARVSVPSAPSAFRFVPTVRGPNVSRRVVSRRVQLSRRG